MTTYSLDAELFIREISKQPAIWNLTSEENKLKNRKDEAWAVVARACITDFDAMQESQKLDIYRKIQSKWRNLRDNYVRSTRRKDRQSRYTHSEFMSFLDAVYQHRATRAEDKKRPKKRRRQRQAVEVNEDSSSCDESHPSTTIEDTIGDIKPNNTFVNNEAVIHIKEESSSDEDIPSIIDNLKRKRKAKERPGFQEMPEEESRITSSTVQDEDRLFFDSLLPVVHEFNLDQKLEFRTQVLHLIKSIRASQL